MRRMSVRLQKDVKEFIEKYASMHGIPKSQAIREIFHLFKYVVLVKNGIYILDAIVETSSIRIPNLKDGEKINVMITDSDVAFLDSVASVLKTNRSVAFRIVLSTSIKFLKMLGLIIE